MTDAGGFPLPKDNSIAVERARLLRQIATALDLPLAAFSQGRSDPTAGDGPSSAECSAALSAFTRIKDPQARAFCQKMLETFAQK